MCTRARACVCMCACMHTVRVCVHVCVCVCACVQYVCVYVCVHVCVICIIIVLYIQMYSGWLSAVCVVDSFSLQMSPNLCMYVYITPVSKFFTAVYTFLYLVLIPCADSWSASNAFLSPQWGGMVIFNPPEANSSAGSSEQAQTRLNMKELMPVFVAQLRELLGVPHVVSTAVVHCSSLCCLWM